jgi:hypothetical protein
MGKAEFAADKRVGSFLSYANYGEWHSSCFSTAPSRYARKKREKFVWLTLHNRDFCWNLCMFSCWVPCCILYTWSMSCARSGRKLEWFELKGVSEMGWRTSWAKNNKMQKRKSPNVGLEPTTPRLRVSCSADWASRADLVVVRWLPTALEFNLRF